MIFFAADESLQRLEVLVARAEHVISGLALAGGRDRRPRSFRPSRGQLQPEPQLRYRLVSPVREIRTRPRSTGSVRRIGLAVGYMKVTHPNPSLVRFESKEPRQSSNTTVVLGHASAAMTLDVDAGMFARRGLVQAVCDFESGQESARTTSMRLSAISSTVETAVFRAKHLPGAESAD